MFKKRIEKIIPNLNKYKYFIIDFDGTLLKSSYMWRHVPSLFVKSKGLKPKSNLDDYCKTLNFNESHEYIKNTYFKGQNIDFEKEIEEFILSKYKNIELIQNARLLLDILKEKGKLYLYTATNSRLIDANLENTKIRDYFESIYTSTNFNYTKQDGIGYLKLIEELNINKDEVLVFEDAPYAAFGASKEFDVVLMKCMTNKKKRRKLKKVCKYYMNLAKLEI